RNSKFEPIEEIDKETANLQVLKKQIQSSSCGTSTSPSQNTTSKEKNIQVAKTGSKLK
ncbi:14465_t:CDS:2, partial [Ambispora leptoticha]